MAAGNLTVSATTFGGATAGLGNVVTGGTGGAGGQGGAAGTGEISGGAGAGGQGGDGAFVYGGAVSASANVQNVSFNGTLPAMVVFTGNTVAGRRRGRGHRGRPSPGGDGGNGGRPGGGSTGGDGAGTLNTVA